MAASDKWYFTKEQLEGTPSRKCGYDSLKELSYRQQAANFIQDMGQRLKVTQLCINTAIVYMHRFYVFHSFTNFTWHQMASAALFLAAKVEEQPRKLEYVIRVANVCRNPKDSSFDITSEKYLAQSQDLVFNENVLLQTLGFDVAIDHPHTHVVRCCQLVRASKDLAQTSYFLASNSLHVTTMCLQYKPTVVACFCIHLACKWSNWEIPLSNEKKEWFSYVDPTVTAELLQQLTHEFLVIFESCPSRLKEKIMAIGDNIPHSSGNHVNSPFDTDPKKIEGKDSHGHRSQHDGKSDDSHKYRSSRPHDSNSIREREYREKKERERLAAQQPGSKPLTSTSGQKPLPHGHHRHPVDPNKYKSSSHSRHPSSGAVPVPAYPPNRVEPRDILREATRDSSFGLPHSRDSHHGKELVRDPQQVRGDKEKRDYLLKHNTNDTNSSTNKYPPGYAPDKHRPSPVDPNRPPRPVDHNKVPLNKQDQVRRTQEEAKPFLKISDNIKKHSSASALYVKPTHSTSQKVMSDPLKTSSVLKQSSSSSSQHKSEVRPHHHNGNNNGAPYDSGYPNPNLLIEPDKPKMEVKIEAKEEIPTPPLVKRPSLFSPEKTPPQQNSTSLKTHSTIKKEDLQSPSIAPIAFMPPGESPVGSGRSRNYSTSSEPELRPVLKKIDQIEGFENLMRDSSIGIKKLQHTPDLLSPIHEDKPAILPVQNDNRHAVPLVNGIETNPTLISNLLKEAPSVPQLSTVSQPMEPQLAPDVVIPSAEESKKDKEHHHKSKKKNKEKHKHKDKDREKEKDREKKKKHKDKDREKHRSKDKQNDTVGDMSTTSLEPKPLVIKIQKDKIQSLPPETPTPSPPSLKIKIPKDKIKTENVGELSQPVVQPTPLGGLKIKISKEVINNCSSGDSSSRKRERERSFNEGPPAKVSKSGVKDKLNGRNSYNKVHLGDSELSQNRLAESKYTKTSSS